MSKRVLLTGVGGFIGAHCLQYFLEKTDWQIACVDSFRHKGTYSRLSEIDIDPNRVRIFQHNLTAPIDQQLENKILGRTLQNEGGLDYIINVASDSAVERSISDPGHCWRNNCELAFNMLEFARKVNPEIYLHVSTDEVFGDCPEDYAHTEWDSIVPSNVYAASKSAQEALSVSYWRTYDLPVVLTNTVNTIGIWQDREKFLPRLIWKIATDQQMEIYADFLPDGVCNIGSRFYLHAQNHADVFVWLADRKPSRYSAGASRPDRYNVTSDVELDNLEMAKLVAEIMGKKLNFRLVSSESARRGYDRRYALDGSKLEKLGWKPPVEFRQGLEQIVKWTLEHPWWVV